MTPQQRAVARSGWTYAFAWVVTRVWMWGLYPLYPFVAGDSHYYFRKLSALRAVGLGQTMNEYPTPVVAGLEALYLPVRGHEGRFLIVFALAMAAADALFAAWLWWSRAPHAHRGAYVWLAFVFCSGPITFFRFDILPAVLAGGALLLLARRPRASGALIALGAGMKLWPALLVAPLLAVRRTRTRVLTGFAVAGAALALASLAVAGWARTISPLTWQKDRGLQIESIAATPLMALKALGASRWDIVFSAFNAYELVGPGTGALLALTTALTALGLVAIAALCARLLRRRRPSVDAIALTLLAIVAIMIVTNKTLSPQYVLWFAGPLAAWVALADPTPTTAHRQRTAVVGGLVLAFTTFLVYPVYYDYICGNGAKAAVAAATLVLVARNALLVIATVWLVMASWRAAGDDAATRPGGVSYATPASADDPASQDVETPEVTRVTG